MAGGLSSCSWPTGQEPAAAAAALSAPPPLPPATTTKATQKVIICAGGRRRITERETKTSDAANWQQRCKLNVKPIFDPSFRLPACLPVCLPVGAALGRSVGRWVGRSAQLQSGCHWFACSLNPALLAFDKLFSFFLRPSVRRRRRRPRRPPLVE